MAPPVEFSPPPVLHAVPGGTGGPTDATTGPAAGTPTQRPAALPRGGAAAFAHAGFLPGSATGNTGLQPGTFSTSPAGQSSPPDIGPLIAFLPAQARLGMLQEVQQRLLLLRDGARPLGEHLTLIEHKLHGLDPDCKHCERVQGALDTLGRLDADALPLLEQLTSLLPVGFRARPAPTETEVMVALNTLEQACTDIGAELNRLAEPQGLSTQQQQAMLEQQTEALLGSICNETLSSEQLHFHAEVIANILQARDPRRRLQDTQAAHQALHSVRQIAAAVDAAQTPDEAGEVLLQAWGDIQKAVGELSQHSEDLTGVPPLASSLASRQPTSIGPRVVTPGPNRSMPDNTQDLLSAVTAATAAMQRQIDAADVADALSGVGLQRVSFEEEAILNKLFEDHPAEQPQAGQTRRRIHPDEIKAFLRQQFAERPTYKIAQEALATRFPDAGEINFGQMAAVLNACFGAYRSAGHLTLQRCKQIQQVLQQRSGAGKTRTTARDLHAALPGIPILTIHLLMNRLSQLEVVDKKTSLAGIAWRYEWAPKQQRDRSLDAPSLANPQPQSEAMVREAMVQAAIAALQKTHADAGIHRLPTAVQISEWISRTHGVFIGQTTVSHIRSGFAPLVRAPSEKIAPNQTPTRDRIPSDSTDHALIKILQEATTDLSVEDIMKQLMGSGLEKSVIARKLATLVDISYFNGAYFLKDKTVALVHLRRQKEGSNATRLWSALMPELQEGRELSKKQIRDVLKSLRDGCSPPEWAKFWSAYESILFETAEGNYRLKFSTDLTGQESSEPAVVQLQRALLSAPIGTQYTVRQLADLIEMKSLNGCLITSLLESGILKRVGRGVYERVAPSMPPEREMHASNAPPLGSTGESDPLKRPWNPDPMAMAGAKKRYDAGPIGRDSTTREPAMPTAEVPQWNPKLHRSGVPGEWRQNPNWIEFENYLVNAPRQVDLNDRSAPVDFANMYAPLETPLRPLQTGGHQGQAAGYKKDDFIVRRNGGGGDCLLHALTGQTLNPGQVQTLRNRIADERTRMPDTRGSRNEMEIATILAQTCGATYAMDAVQGLQSVPNAVLAMLQRVPGVFLGDQEIQHYCELEDRNRGLAAQDPGLTVVVIGSDGSIIRLTRNSSTLEPTLPGEDRLARFGRILQAVGGQAVYLYKTQAHYELIEGINRPGGL